VLANVWQRQQQRCQEIFNNIFAGNLTSCRKYLSSYILECHIYNSFIDYKSILRIEIIVQEVLFLDFVAGKKNIFSSRVNRYTGYIRCLDTGIAISYPEQCLCAG
jgi:hypothetical protein